MFFYLLLIQIFSQTHKMKLLFLFITLFSDSVYAQDNPDAADYIAEFKGRILPFENYVDTFTW
ncbi:hypothetical protein MNBD_GAMMA09-1912 [hydrothermal vent metagenome]|uniref:Uncharacterized protein n=1 Tax=hydrothermal vent metagenome TaxID=652676 RepID=A0A3B0YJ91_9ZZZZ